MHKYIENTIQAKNEVILKQIVINAIYNVSFEAIPEGISGYQSRRREELYIVMKSDGSS
jgi:hypothetical protein